MSRGLGIPHMPWLRNRLQLSRNWALAVGNPVDTKATDDDLLLLLCRRFPAASTQFEEKNIETDNINTVIIAQF